MSGTVKTLASEPVMRWQDPPATITGGWKQVTARLQERPGEWCLIVEDERPSYAYQSVSKSLRRYGCQTTTRMRDGGVSVWARWPE